MRIGVHDRLLGIASGESCGASLAICIVLRAAVASKVAGFMDDRTGLGVCSKSWGSPEHWAEMDGTKGIRVDEGCESSERDTPEMRSRVPYTPSRVQVQSYLYEFGLPDWMFL